MPNYFPEIDPVTGEFLSPLVQDAIDARAAAAGSVGHNHDDRYYTEAEADGRFVRTVNGTGPDGAGNVTVEVAAGGSGSGWDLYADLDYTGATDSSAALQAYCDQGAATGKRVVMGPGTIRLDSTVTLPGGLYLTGQGVGRTIIQTPVTSAAFGGHTSRANITVERLEITGIRHVAYAVDRKGMFFTYVNRLTLRDVFVHDTAATGIGIDFITGTIENCWVKNCGRLGNTGTGGSSGIGIGVGATQWEPLTITNCHTEGNKRFGIFIETQHPTHRPAGLSVIGCTATGNQHGFGDCGATGTRWVGNTARDNTEAGFSISGGTLAEASPSSRSIVSDCYAYGNRDGIHVHGFKAADVSDAVRLADNTVMGNTRDGIRLEATGPAVIARLVAEDNTVMDNGGAGVRVTGGGAFTKVSVLGNACDNNAGGGIRIESTVNGLMATRNDIRSGGGSYLLPTGDSVTTGNHGNFIEFVPTYEVPETLPGLNLWLRADALTGYADGQALTLWQDSSNAGAGATVTAGTATWESSEVNGLPLVKLAQATMASPAPQGGPEQTIFVVFKQPTGSTKRSLLSSAGAALQVRVGETDKLEATHIQTALIGASTNSIGDNAPAIGTVTFSDSANAWRVRLNGVEATGATGATIAPGTVVLGDVAATMNIAEVIKYSTVLSLADIQTIEAYLATKYGITVA